MTLKLYVSTQIPLDVVTRSDSTNYKDTYPNGDYAPAVRVYTTTTTTSVAKNGFKTYQESRNSSASPNWKLLIRKGLPLPFNEYSYNKYEDRDWEGYLSQKSPPNTYGTSQNTFQTGSWYFANFPRLCEGRVESGCQGLMSQRDRDMVLNKALMKIIAKIKDQKVDVGVAIGEHKQTMRLVADNAIRIAGALSALKRGDFAGAANKFGSGLKTRARGRFDRDYVGRDRSKALSRAWLELQYGWKPLLDDIYGACEQLAKQPRQVYQQVTGHAFYGHTISGTYQKSSYSQCREDGIHRLDEKFVVRYSTANLIVQDLNTIGLLNPATVAWELMPWSFVIDWFLPIGNWLGSFGYTAGLTFMDGCHTTYEEITSTAVYTNFGFNGTNNLDGVRIKKSKSVKVQRVKIYSFPAVPYPSFKNPVSTGHMLNALALLTQLRK